VPIQKQRKLTGRRLNAAHKIGASQALYREDGKWYHALVAFPGALFDAHGFVLFRTHSEYEACEHVHKGPDPNHIHVDQGISKIPGYQKYTRPVTR
jgi:5-methylcytosine-specific restriction enzyme A